MDIKIVQTSFPTPAIVRDRDDVNTIFQSIT
jgi:hypothetical protein